MLYSFLKVAQKLFPDRFNIDVIFGRPHQTLSSWVKELRKVKEQCTTIQKEDFVARPKICELDKKFLFQNISGIIIHR